MSRCTMALEYKSKNNQVHLKGKYMSATKDSRGIFLLQGDQLSTLKHLGKVCGVRVKKAARLCGEDPLLLSLMILNRFCNKFSRLERGKRKLQEMLNRKWQQKGCGNIFAPQNIVEQTIDAYSQRYAHQTLHLLSDFLNGDVGGAVVSNKLGDDKILAQLVFYAVSAEQSSFADNHISGSGAWLRLCRILREEKRRAVREGNLVVSRDKAMSFLASVFLAQLISTYRVEPRTAFLNFAIALYDTVDSAS